MVSDGRGKNRIAFLLGSTALGWLAATTPSQAQTAWTGSTSTDWFNAGNWSSGVPTAATATMIDAITPNATVVGAPGAQVNALTVGNVGAGTLNIQNGGTVNNSSGSFIGYYSGSTGTVTVEGVGSSWSNFSSVHIGRSGTGTLNIQNGGAVINFAGYIGDQANSTGTVTVDGVGSSWTNFSNVTAGNAGNGMLNIRNGGSVSSTFGFIGFAAGSTGTVTVDGAGSSWTNSGQLHIGEYGTGTLDVQNGGTVSYSSGGYIGYYSGSIGTLNIRNGGTVNNNSGSFIGYSSGSTGTVTVDGAGSSWTNFSSVHVGEYGTGTLNIQNGGAVSNFAGYIGNQANSTSTVTVDGAGSSWTNFSNVTVGNAGNGMLNIRNGGSVSSTFGFVGFAGGSTGAVTVDGAGSTWTNSGQLHIGEYGTGALNIQNGGIVSAVSVEIASQAGSIGALNIGAGVGQAAAAPGLLTTPTVTFGAGIGQIVFNHTASNYTFAPVISGAGSVHVEAGTTLLTSNNSYTGATTIDGGKLVVNGSIASSFATVNSGGTLGGNGTVGGLTANSGGAVAPGNSIGTLNVAGNVTFNLGSIYLVEVNAAGQSDRIAATGSATLNGGIVQVNSSGAYAFGSHYTILTATGGVSGAFSGLSQSSPFLSFGLSYDPNNVYLDINRSSTTFASVGGTPNQSATGGGLDSVPLSSPLVNVVAQLDAISARRAFDQLSGEAHASAKTALIEDSHFVRDAAVDRLRAAFDAVGAMKTPVMSYASVGPEYLPATTDRFALWGRAFGSWGHTDGDANVARLNRSTGGLFVGGDGLVVETSRVGLLAGYSHTNFNVRDRNSSGTSDNYHVGLYGGTQFGNLAFRTGAAYTWHDISTSRSVAFPGYFDISKGKYDARTAQVFGELAYGVRAAAVGFEPFANLAYVNLHTDGFRETGGVAALTSNGGSTDATFSTLGLRASSNFVLGGIGATARGTLGWRHVFGDVTPLSAMTFAGGSAFTIAGVPIARNAAVIEAGLDLAITPNATLGVSYSGQFASVVSDQSVRGNFNWRF